ncbi:MAG TPA: LamG domain-containing protein [Sedimentisphaerales bacterium]|nr:LamG domain-containing protein [Sedimentisphaerales bacterium]
MSKKMIYLFSLVLLAALNSNALAGLIDDSALVIYYSFDSVSDIVTDQSGNGHDGVVNGDITAEPSGKYSGAAKFTTGSYFDLDGENFPVEEVPTTGITLAAWIKCENTGGDHAIFNARASDATWLIHPEARSNGEFRWLLRSYGGTTIFDIRAGSVTWDEWIHFAGTYDKAAGKAILYINGELVREENISNAADIAGDWASGARVGYNIDNARPFTGLMDDFLMFRRALSQAEVKKLMQGMGSPFAFGPAPGDGSLNAETWANLGWYPGDSAVSHDVYFGDNFNAVDAGTAETYQGNQTDTFFVVGFPGFPFPDGLVPGTTYYWRIDEVNDTEPNSPWKGEVWSFMIPPRTAYYPIPADGAEFIDPDVELSWTGGFGAKLHTVYFGDNFDEVNNATGGLPQGATTYTPGTLELEKVYYWRVDEFDSINTYKGDVWGFTTPGAVGSLKPSNGAVDVKQMQILSWLPGDHAASHDVYLGTDKDAVRNADAGSPEYKGTRDLGSESYDPGKLQWDVTYYWHIDEVNNANPDSPWVGPVWSFTTANFLVVDDFESYNDIDPPDPESNRIFEAWPDGYDIPTNGALVGNELPPYAEQSIVHSGIQSMPYFYDNSAGNSEATHTLTYPRDWTENGVTTLTIWFRGISDNAAETLYVALNGNVIVTNDNPDAAQITTWTQWDIDLQAFADQGVDLTNVDTIALGLGNKNNPQAGGSGTMYFDDIRLYPPAFTAPSETNLVGWWKLDESSDTIAVDSSGHENNGSLNGTAMSWMPDDGMIGGALSFDGIASGTDYVEISAADISLTAGTIAMWGKLRQDPQLPDTRYFVGHTTIPAWGSRIQLYMDNADTMLDLGLGDSHARQTDIMSLTTETWYHVALTWDGSNYVVYVNGEEKANGSYTGLDSLNTVADIGNDGNTAADGRTEAFNGLLDDVRIYNVALTGAEISNLAGAN